MARQWLNDGLEIENVAKFVKQMHVGYELRPTGLMASMTVYPRPLHALLFKY